MARAERAGVQYFDAAAERAFLAAEGPHVITGPDANWIPAGSLVVIDECHLWFDSRDQRGAEPRELLDYISQHRHHLHRVLLGTQNRMQTSITLRRQCSWVVRCVDKRRMPFLLGLPLPMIALFYEKWAPELEDVPGAKPAAIDIELPRLSGGVRWRLYESFTHVGGKRRLAATMAAARAAVIKRPVRGIGRGGKAGRVMRFIWRLVRWLLWGLIATTAGIVFAMMRPGGVVSTDGTGSVVAVARGAEGGTGQTSTSVVPTTAPATAPVEPSLPGQLGALTREGAVIGGRFVRTGRMVDNVWRLVVVDVEKGRVGLVHSGGWIGIAGVRGEWRCRARSAATVGGDALDESGATGGGDAGGDAGH
jgi:hypothetical protein